MTALGVVDTEPLESRVLLSATDGSALGQISSSETGGYASVLANSSGVYSNVSSNYFGSDVFAAASTDDPLTQQYGSAAFGTYLSNGESANGNSFQQAMTNQQNAAAAGGATGGTSSSGGDSSGSGSSGDGSSDAADEALEPLLPAWKPFVMPAGVEFPQVAQPFESQQDNLFAVLPVGTDSFIDTSTITSEIGGVYSGSSEANTAGSLPLTGLTTIVTSEQTYNSPTDWIVRQSVTRNLEQDPDDSTVGSTASGDDSESSSGADSSRQGRNAARTFSITVINGTTTITSLHLSDSFTFEDGSIPGESDSQDKFTIPEEWVQKSLTSVNAGASSPNGYLGATTTGSNEPPVGDAAVDGSGTFVKADYDFSVDVTKSLVTLEDGTPGIQHTLVISFSASFTARTGGQYSIDESDLPPEMLSELAGMTVDAWGDYQLFIGGSVAGNFTATATLPLSVNLANADFTTSFYLGASFQLGGNLNSHVKAVLNQSSGSTSDGTDEYERATISNDEATAGYFGASFWLGVSSENEGDESSDEDDAGGEYPAEENDDAAQDTIPGQQSAEDLIAEERSGIQFSLQLNGSHETVDIEHTQVKVRAGTSPNNSLLEEDVYKQVKSKMNVQIEADLGTEEVRTSIGYTGGETNATNYNGTIWWQTDTSGSDLWNERKKIESNMLFDSHHRFEITLGGGDGGTLILEEGGIYKWATLKDDRRGYNEALNQGSINHEVYRNYWGTPQEGDFTPRERFYIGTVQDFGVPDNSVRVLFNTVPPEGELREPDGVTLNGQRGLGNILEEYRNRSIQLARLQALVAQLQNQPPGTVDPEQLKYLTDAIAVQTQILAVVAAQAKAAGATQTQLDELSDEAAQAADGDPIAWQPWDGGESTTTAYWYGSSQKICNI